MDDLFMSELENKFQTYHAENPHVFVLFRAYANKVRMRGFNRYSANAIFERIRWHIDVETSGDQFKMNNNYRAFYARKLMREDVRFHDFFAVREQPTERQTS